MRAHVAGAVMLGAVALGLGLGGCTGRRIEGNVYRSEQGYRIRIPGAAWRVADDSRADLELRRVDGQAAMLVHATCRADTRRRSLDVLGRHLLLGLRDRETLEDEAVIVADRAGRHLLVEGRRAGDDAGRRVRVEAYTVRDARCVYDLLYVAPPPGFDAGRGDFRGFVDSLAME